MAEQFTIEAVLSARDAGFKAGLQAANKETATLGSRLKSGMAFGVFQSLGMKAVNGVTGVISSLTSELAENQASWKTFENNMAYTGHSIKNIRKVKGELQDFATKTIYSASDMASTYAQLDAVGVKSCTNLVKGFGGLAGAAENPRQAMATLTQQGTQMAAQPMVLWQDFRLMLQQTPAGIAAVAKSMGKSTDQLVKDVRAGKVSTQDFFKAIEKAGNSKAMQKQATQYKTVGQAMDGLKETAANKVMPVFNAVTKIMIKDISKLADSANGINFEKFGSWITKNEAKLRKGAKAIGLIGSALVGMMIVNKIVGTLGTFAGHLQSLGRATAGLAGKLIGTAAGEAAVGEASTKSAKPMLEAGAAFLMMGAGILLVAAGFYILAQSAIMLSNAGNLSIGILVGMVVVIGALFFIISKVGPQALIGAVAFLIFSVALIICAGALWIMAQAVKVVANTLPLFAQYGIKAAISIVVLGVALVGFGAIAMLAGVMLIIAGALFLVGGLLAIVGGMMFMIAGGMVLMGGMLAIVGGAMFIVMGVMMVVAAGLAMVLFAALKLVKGQLTGIAQSATTTATMLVKMQTAMGIVNTGLSALGGRARSAIDALKNAFSGGTSNVINEGRRLGTGYSNSMQSGLSKSPGIASRMVSSINSRLRSGASGARYAGMMLSHGLANGMESGASRVEAAAARIVAAVDKAVRKKGEIHSPSSLLKRTGVYFPMGLGKGIIEGLPYVQDAFNRMFNLPQINSPQLAFGGGYGEFHEEYDYNGVTTVYNVVKMNGKTIAEGTSEYMEEIQNKRNERAERRKGRR